MATPISFDFGPGRSSLGRGLVALVAGPAVMAVAVAAGLFLWGAWRYGDPSLPQLSSALRTLWGIVQALTLFTVTLGGPTWLILRTLKQERGWVYVVAGVTEAAAIALWIISAFSSTLGPAMTPILALAGLIGGCTAGLFWMIAREPGSVGDDTGGLAPGEGRPPR